MPYKDPEKHREWAKAYSKAKHPVRHLKEKYGLSHEEYVAILKSQGCRCAICRNLPFKERLAVDHDHTKKRGEPGYIRGLLCKGCNLGIGHLRNSPLILASAISYLEK